MSGGPEEILGEGRFTRLVRRDGWEFIDHPVLRGIVVLVAVTPGDRLLLVEQYRTPLGRRVLELPAGMAGDRPGHEHEPLAEAAARELEEETGYRAGRLAHLAHGPMSPGRSAFLYDFFLGEDLTRTGPGGGDEHEDIVVHEAPLAGIDAWLEERRAGGLVIDTKIYAGLYLLRARRGA